MAAHAKLFNPLFHSNTWPHTASASVINTRPALVEHQVWKVCPGAHPVHDPGQHLQVAVYSPINVRLQWSDSWIVYNYKRKLWPFKNCCLKTHGQLCIFILAHATWVQSSATMYKFVPLSSAHLQSVLGNSACHWLQIATGNRLQSDVDRAYNALFIRTVKFYLAA